MLNRTASATQAEAVVGDRPKPRSRRIYWSCERDAVLFPTLRQTGTRTCDRRRLVVQRFIAEKNIQHFKNLLAREVDERRREVLRRMIGEEEVKLAASPPDDPRPS
jgi:hypothetical protein